MHHSFLVHFLAVASQHDYDAWNFLKRDEDFFLFHKLGVVSVNYEFNSMEIYLKWHLSRNDHGKDEKTEIHSQRWRFSCLRWRCSHEEALATTLAKAMKTLKKRSPWWWVCYAKQQLCTCIALFLYISFPSLYDYDVKMPNFTLSWRT